jgi:hypothetical protein
LISFGRDVKFWIFACLCSLLVWIAIMFPMNLKSFFNVVSGRPDLVAGNVGMFMAEYVGLIARFFGVILALAVGFMIWFRPVRSIAKIERIVEAALFLEAAYYVLLFPSGLWRVSSGLNFSGVAYLLRAVSAGVVLMVLSFKVRGSANNVSVLKWVAIAAVGYVGALWCNVVFKWFDMIAMLGSSFLLIGVSSWGFLGSMITMSLGVVFAVFGGYLLAKNNGESVWWFGLSLIMVGINYVIYLAYVFSASSLDFALPLDIWTLPFIGLGVSLLKMKATKKVL